MTPGRIIAAEAIAFPRGPIRWKRSSEHYVESHCGMWRITPVYGGLTQPESYELRLEWTVVDSGRTQAECKGAALWLISPSARARRERGEG